MGGGGARLQRIVFRTVEPNFLVAERTAALSRGALRLGSAALRFSEVVEKGRQQRPRSRGRGAGSGSDLPFDGGEAAGDGGGGAEMREKAIAYLGP